MNMKKLVLGATLSLTLAGGAINVAANTPMAVAPASAATLPAARLAAPVSQVSLDGARLSTAQMAETSGDGWWSRLKRWVKKTVKKVIGVIVQEIIKAITEALEEWLTDTSGGDTQETTEASVENYASQADYEAGIVSNAYVEDTGWQQTNIWYGYNAGGGGCGGSGGTELYSFQREAMVVDQPCYMY